MRHQPEEKNIFLWINANSYSFVSEVGNFGDELSAPGLSKRYEPDIPSIKEVSWSQDYNIKA